MTQHPFDDALAAYALDALESSEAARLEGHLATCAACRAEVAILRDASALLATTVVRVQPSAGMRARVLAKAVATRGTAAPAATRMTPWRMTPWLLAAASLVITLGLGAAYARERSARLDLVASAAMLERVLGPEVETTTLAATGTAPSLRLFWDHEARVMIVSARRLPPAPIGRTYQLWGIGADGKPVGLGTFNTQPDGGAVVTLTVAGDTRFDVSAVTDEPEGGSPQPTTTPFLVGRWPSTI